MKAVFKFKKQFIWSIFIFTIAFNKSYAQPYLSFYPSEINEQLFQNTITGINKDKFGYLWISSQFGLYSYDGHNLISYNTASTSKLKSNRFAGIFKIPNNNQLFTIDEFDNIYTLENRNIRSYLPEKKLNYLFYKNTILLNKDPLSKFHVYKVDTLNDSESGKNPEVIFENSKIKITDIHRKVTVYSNNLELTMSYQSRFQLLSISEKSIIVQLDQKIYNINLTNLKIIFQIYLEKSFLYDLLTAYYDEQYNIIYCGTYNNGLIQFSPNATSSFTSSQNPEEFTYTYSYAYDSISNSIFSVSAFGVFQWNYNNPNLPPKVIQKGKWSGSFCKILKNRELIFCLNDKIMGYSIQNKKISFQVNFNSDVNDVFELNNNIYFISANRMYLIKNKKVIPVKALETSYYIFKVKMIGKYVYLATSNGIIVLNDQLQEIQIILKNKTVRDFQFFKQNLIAATYGSGVYIVKNNKEYAVPFDQKKWMLAAISLRTDNLKRFWVICNKGIFIVPQKSIEALTFDSTNYQTLTNISQLPCFELNGGLYPENWQVIQNQIVLPSDHGLIQIQQIANWNKKSSLNISIDKILENDKVKLPIKNKITLTAEHTSLEIVIGTQYYNSITPLPIFYKLKNIDENWQRLPPNRIIKFSRIPPGNYTLFILNNNHEQKILEITVNQIWYKSIWTVIGSIILISFLIAFALLQRNKKTKIENQKLDILVSQKTHELQFAIAELTKAQSILKDEYNFKNRLYAVLMHDIKSPLMFLSQSSFLVYNQHKETQNELTNIIRIAANTSKELHDFISDFLNWLGTQFIDYKLEFSNANIKNIITDLVEFYQPIAQSKNLIIKTEQVSEDIEIITNITVLQTILRNFIDNAIKYTKEGEIKIATSEEPDHVKIKISDSGNGLPPEIVELIENWETQKLSESLVGHSTTHKMGIKITLEFIRLIEGTIEYSQGIPSGSNIEITLKKSIN